MRRWGTLAATTVLAAGSMLVLRTVDPFAEDSPLPGCPFFALTGLYCPGCGSTRCLHALAHGDVAQAFAMNPLLVIAIPLLAVMALQAARVRMPLPPALLRATADPMLWLTVLVAYWIARNLPWWPFNLLAPV